MCETPCFYQYLHIQKPRSLQQPDHVAFQMHCESCVTFQLVTNESFNPGFRCMTCTFQHALEGCCERSKRSARRNDRKTPDADTWFDCARSVGFTDKDADDRKKRMWVHRRVKKEDDDNNEHNNDEHNEEHNNEYNNEPDDEPDDDMSTVTMSVGSSSATSSVKHCAPASVQVRMTVSGKQQHRMIGKSITEHKKKAHKRATTLYANELKKPSSKRRSSEVIAEEVREEYDGHGPCGRTIRTYASFKQRCNRMPRKGFGMEWWSF